jgi:DNA primase
VIKQESIDKVIDAARIEEVVGDFVALKKRGASLTGLCPFHNEKTPSFYVSVAKGIYKCFGCGEGGDSVRFVMQLEKYSYPEAIRYLAEKYHILLEETVQTDEQAQLKDHRESLLIASQFAKQFFVDQLWHTDEGKAIGLNYFKERGYREDIIQKFELGYSPEAWEALHDKAKADGHDMHYFEETGLLIRREDGRYYDRFRGRVLFPIHNLTGRVLGFGGRTLKSDKKIPKYVNSPESGIYHKSDVLYGLYLAKKSISDLDQCYLVEGYADVIAMHQAGVENVVSSSGTSLTNGQIRLISRYTKQVTILFDGDEAGIQASLRGTDMLLEEGLNVRVLLFPDGNDPDSYIRQFGSQAFQTYLQKNAEDFIAFKTKILLRHAGNDPIKRAEVIKEVVHSISLVPDEIKATVFLQECSRLLDISERVLLSEMNKVRNEKFKKSFPAPTHSQSDTNQHPDVPPDHLFADESTPNELNPSILQEKEFVRVLLNYGDVVADWEPDSGIPVAPLLLNSLGDITFEEPQCAKIIKIYRTYIDKQELPDERLFVGNKDEGISQLAISLLAQKYYLSPNWNDDKRKIYVSEEKEHLKELVYTSVYRLQKRWVEQKMHQLRQSLQERPSDEDMDIILASYQNYKDKLKTLSEKLGTIVLK